MKRKLLKLIYHPIIRIINLDSVVVGICKGLKLALLRLNSNSIRADERTLCSAMDQHQEVLIDQFRIYVTDTAGALYFIARTWRPLSCLGKIHISIHYFERPTLIT